MKTINQINGAIQLYRPQIDHYLKTKEDRKTGKYFEIRLGHGNYSTPVLSNCAYGNVIKYVQGTRMIEGKHIHIEVNDLKFYFAFNIDPLHGVICHLHHSPLKDYQGKRWLVRSKDTWDNFNPYQYANKIIEEIFYPEGLFRNIQTTFMLTKKEALKKYRELYERWNRPKEIDPIDRELACIKFMERKLRRKRNIRPDDYLTTSELIKVYENTARKPFLREIKRFNPFQLLDDLTLEYDDDSYLEMEAHNVIMGKRVIWV